RGGPGGEAACTFGSAMLDAQNFSFGATGMAGGMVAPLGLAIATTVFKKKFTEPERVAGKTAEVLGASCMTEGVMRVAAADP
ncbi:PTS fructose transporter subunit IIA, partial [Planococcus sp. SIMBA_143]